MYICKFIKLQVTGTNEEYTSYRQSGGPLTALISALPCNNTLAS